MPHVKHDIEAVAPFGFGMELTTTVAAAAGPGHRPRRAGLARLLLLGAFSLGGCSGGGNGPQIPPPPPPGAHQLELAPFAALGSGKIVFLRADFSTTGGRDGVYLIDADRAASTFEFVGGPAWYPNAPTVSPDGRSVAYTRYTDGNTMYDVYVANLDGSREQQITAFPTQEGPASWTPDGRELVFYAAESDWVYNLYRQAADKSAASSREQITHFSGSCGGQCPLLSSDATGRVSVSPSGQIAWTTGSTIELTEPDSGATQAIYTLPPDAPATSAALYAPVWSPDGSHLGFVTLVRAQASGVPAERQRLVVTVIDAEGTNQSVVAAVPASGLLDIGGYSDVYSLCWTADGARFVFNVPDGDPQSHLWVVNVDGSALTQVTSAPGVWDLSVSCSR
jgi:Tol biopolymer transport system component